MASNAFADCQPSAVTLNVGDKVADCQRIGVTKPTMDQINKDLVTGDYNGRIADEQKRVITLKDLQISDLSKDRDLWKSEADRERDVVSKQQDKTNWGLWGGIFAGIGLTVLAGWGLGQVAHR